MSKAFKKGDAVTVLADWDGKGTFYFRHAAVHSCGAKRMLLTCADTGEEFGSEYAPVRGDVQTLRLYNWHGVFNAMTDDLARAVCLGLGAALPALVAEENKRREDYPMLRPVGEDLHEPRALSYAQACESVRRQA